MPFFRLAGLVLAGVAGCGGGGGDGGSGQHRVTRAESLIGVGLPSAWQNQPREIVRANADAGLTFTSIEWVTPGAFAQCDGGRTGKFSTQRGMDWFATDPVAAADLMDEARTLDVRVLVNVVNGNNCAAMAQLDAWFSEQLDAVLALAPDLVSPVSEDWVLSGAQRTKARRWIAIGRQRIPADRLVLPRGHTGGAFTDEHYCDDEALLADLAAGQPGVIANTDCGSIVNPGPARAAAFARAALATGSPLLIYPFWETSPPTDTIAAMGAEVAR